MNITTVFYFTANVSAKLALACIFTMYDTDNLACPSMSMPMLTDAGHTDCVGLKIFNILGHRKRYLGENNIRISSDGRWVMTAGAQESQWPCLV